ncbi:hypothetical protein B0P06_004249 [Clostridium saccharoperbutylacetonicum]|uniref:hypothetical protein n=1 Tax=Clostridium saccharoperbutylacetonicum TaxID=36745 RepID=UPI000349C20F|nr:hypothetical protein [Clostridium saccharoperbutylacetonicum]NRT61782.1 hypothetical protein [Clostridium saccharoperbutylacetonicum]NSB25106.1 hypothetical protein [Clostridium saccharoperbutylacetonicum]NSB44478.1 hypothetical protein [Clostridium saccharoperbutylacetonicum]
MEKLGIEFAEVKSDFKGVVEWENVNLINLVGIYLQKTITNFIMKIVDAISKFILN